MPGTLGAGTAHTRAGGLRLPPTCRVSSQENSQQACKLPRQKGTRSFGHTSGGPGLETPQLRRSGHGAHAAGSALQGSGGQGAATAVALSSAKSGLCVGQQRRHEGSGGGSGRGCARPQRWRRGGDASHRRTRAG